MIHRSFCYFLSFGEKYFIYIFLLLTGLFKEILNEFSKGANGEPAGPRTAQSDKKGLSLSRSRHTDTKSPSKSKISGNYYNKFSNSKMK